MLQTELLNVISAYKHDEIKWEAVKTAVDRYSSALLQQAHVKRSGSGTIAEAFEELRKLSTGWDDVKCVCSELGRSRCDLSCPEYEDE